MNYNQIEKKDHDMFFLLDQIYFGVKYQEIMSYFSLGNSQILE